MAVDVGDATSIVDAINLTFIYDKINEADCFTARPTIVSVHDGPKGGVSFLCKN